MLWFLPESGALGQQWNHWYVVVEELHNIIHDADMQ